MNIGLHVLVCLAVVAILNEAITAFVPWLESKTKRRFRPAQVVTHVLVTVLAILYLFKVAVPGAYRQFFLAGPVTFVAEKDRSSDGSWVKAVYLNSAGDRLVVTVYNDRSIKYANGLKLPADVQVPLPPTQ